MSTTVETYTGKDCSVTLTSGEIGMWSRYQLEITTERRPAKPAKSKIYKQVTIHRHAKLTLEGFRGGNETFGDLATSDTAATPTITDPPPDWADFTGWRILDCSMSQDDGPGTYSMTLEQGNIGTSTAITASGSASSS